MNNSLHVADNFIETVLLECINEWYQLYHYAYHTMTVLLEYIDHSLQFFTNVINIYFTLPYYAGLCLMLSMTHYTQNYASIISGYLITNNGSKHSTHKHNYTIHFMVMK